MTTERSTASAKRRPGRPVNPAGGIDKARILWAANTEAAPENQLNTHELVDLIVTECGVNKTSARLYIYRFRKEAKARDNAYVSAANELYEGNSL